MFCKYCGKELAEGSSVCSHCGQDNAPEEVAVPARKQSPLKLVAVVLAAVLLLAALAWLVYTGVTGGFKPKENNVYYKESYSVNADEAMANREKVVATLDGHSLTNGQLQVFYWMQFIDYINNYGGYGLDYTKPLDTQICDEETGLTWQQYFLENALNAWEQYMALNEEAKKAGFEMPLEYRQDLDKLEESLQKAATDNKFESVDAMLQSDMGPGCTFEDYQYYMELYYYGNLYFSSLTEKIEVTDKEIEDYYVKNEASLKGTNFAKGKGILVDVRHILIQPEGGTKGENDQVTYSDAEWEACRIEAQKIYDEWLAGDKTEDSFAQMAAEHSQDGNASSGGLYTYVYKGQMVEEFENWCFDESRQYGDSGLVKTKFGYHIMYYVEGDEGWIRYCRNGVTNDKAMALLEELAEGYTYAADYKLITMGAADMSA